jgi:hypothetical protein
MGSNVRYRHLALGIVIIPAFFASTASSARFTSTSYIIDASVNNSFGGQSSSTNYKAVTSAGESIIGDGSGGSYKMGAGYVSQLDHGMQLTVQPGGLVAYYPFDEGTGSRLNDSTANSNTGTAIGSPLWTPGKLGGAMQFDGTTQSVKVAQSSALNIETMSLEAWVKTTQVPGTSDVTVVEKWGASGAYPYSLRLLSTGKVQFAAFDGTSYVYITSGTTANDGAWHHFVGVRQVGGQMMLYKDGVLSAQTSDFATAGTTTNGSGLVIGARSDGTHGFVGSVDELKIYNRPLTANEVKAEYDAQSMGNAAGVHMGNILPGASNTALLDAVVQTDAAGYNLAVSQNQSLTSGGNTIPSVSGSIASPVSWNEGTTKGLGFTLYGTNATAIPAKWNGGGAYAAFPASPTSFYTRTGYTAGAKDYVNMRMRLDVAITQATASYQNMITVTGTILP